MSIIEDMTAPLALAEAVARFLCERDGLHFLPDPPDDVCAEYRKRAGAVLQSDCHWRRLSDELPPLEKRVLLYCSHDEDAHCVAYRLPTGAESWRWALQGSDVESRLFSEHNYEWWAYILSPPPG